LFPSSKKSKQERFQAQIILNPYKGLTNPIKQLILSRLNNNRSLKAKPFSRNVQGVSFI